MRYTIPNILVSLLALFLFSNELSAQFVHNEVFILGNIVDVGSYNIYELSKGNLISIGKFEKDDSTYNLYSKHPRKMYLYTRLYQADSVMKAQAIQLECDAPVFFFARDLGKQSYGLLEKRDYLDSTKKVYVEEYTRAFQVKSDSLIIGVHLLSLGTYFFPDVKVYDVTKQNLFLTSNLRLIQVNTGAKSTRYLLIDSSNRNIYVAKDLRDVGSFESGKKVSSQKIADIDKFVAFIKQGCITHSYKQRTWKNKQVKHPSILFH